MDHHIVDLEFRLMHHADYLRENAGRDHHRNAELLSLRQTVDKEIAMAARSFRKAVCAYGVMGQAGFCAVP